MLWYAQECLCMGKLGEDCACPFKTVAGNRRLFPAVAETSVGGSCAVQRDKRDVNLFADGKEQSKLLKWGHLALGCPQGNETGKPWAVVFGHNTCENVLQQLRDQENPSAGRTTGDYVKNKLENLTQRYYRQEYEGNRELNERRIVERQMRCLAR